jgi:hypothetical protein
MSEYLDVAQWQTFIGSWATEATHPMLSGATIRGEATFEWLAGQRFVIQRSGYDHPDIPDAIAVIGVTDERLSMHYFDFRGVHRVYEVGLCDGTWRYWRDAPGFSQRFIATLSEDAGTIVGQGELSRDGSTWEGDLAITYRRVS